MNINTVFVTYMWNLKNNTNECIYKIETESQTKQTFGYHREERSVKGQIRGMGLNETNYYISNK